MAAPFAKIAKALRTTKIFWRINHQIRAPEVRVIGSDGKQIGILKISDALKKAQETGLDLVEIAAKANPPVAKIADVNKLRYQEEKKKRAEKKKSKAAEQKEIRFSPFIGQSDYETRLKRVTKFLADGHKVKVTVKFLGRQMGKRSFGYDLLRRLSKDLGELGIMEGEPKFLGRHLIAIYAKVSKKHQNAKTENKKTNLTSHQSNKKGQNPSA